MKPEQLLVAALELPAAERLYLADRLTKSLSPEERDAAAKDQDLYRELDRRYASLAKIVHAEELWQDA